MATSGSMHHCGDPLPPDEVGGGLSSSPSRGKMTRKEMSQRDSGGVKRPALPVLPPSPLVREGWGEGAVHGRGVRRNDGQPVARTVSD